MFNKKRAQGIPMETVVIAIIVLVVLVVIIAFFVGGTGSVMEKFKTIFTGAKGDDIANVKNGCQSLCDSAVNANLPGKDSAYCKASYKIDTKNAGTPDACPNPQPNGPKFNAFHCDSSNIGVSCSLDCSGANRPTCI